MEVTLNCMKCRRLNGAPSSEYVDVPYYNDRIALHTCSQGHVNATVLQSQKFEVLLESGARALLARFTLEASSSTAAALERYFEFALHVLLTHRGITADQYVSLFKQMSSQSERQLGAFMTMWALEFGEVYAVPKKFIEDRNRVIHKGHIFKPDECEAFCAVAYGEIYRLHATLKARCQPAITKVVMEDIQERCKALPKQSHISVTGTDFFNIADETSRPIYKDQLKRYEQMMSMFNAKAMSHGFAESIVDKSADTAIPE